MKKSKIIKFLVPMAGLVSLVAVPASLVTSCADKKPTITINIGDYVYHGYTDPEFIQKINDASTGGIKISLDEIASYSIFTVNESLLTLTNGTKINLVHDFTNFIHDSWWDFNPENGDLTRNQDTMPEGVDTIFVPYQINGVPVLDFNPNFGEYTNFNNLNLYFSRHSQITEIGHPEDVRVFRNNRTIHWLDQPWLPSTVDYIDVSAFGCDKASYINEFTGVLDLSNLIAPSITFKSWCFARSAYSKIIMPNTSVTVEGDVFRAIANLTDIYWFPHNHFTGSDALSLLNADLKIHLKNNVAYDQTEINDWLQSDRTGNLDLNEHTFLNDCVIVEN